MADKADDSQDFLAKVEAVARKDGRYRAQAYLFVFESLEFTLRRMKDRGHVTGQELLAGIRDFALLNFGAMGRAVFNEWGLKDSADFGRIVFSLVEAGLMSKKDTDRLEDFAGGFDFAEVFEKRYVPADLGRPSKGKKRSPKKA